jgi:hypothetical protein
MVFWVVAFVNPRGANTTTALGVISGGDNWADARSLEMQAFEQLPDQLREIVQQNVTNLGAQSVLAFYRSIARQVGYLAAITITARKLHKLENEEISVWAGRFRSRWNTVLPHIAANASILRYYSDNKGGYGQKRSRNGPRIEHVELVPWAS